MNYKEYLKKSTCKRKRKITHITNFILLVPYTTWTDSIVLIKTGVVRYVNSDNRPLRIDDSDLKDVLITRYVIEL